MRLCSIASGSSGNCIYVGDDQTHLLVDTGISKKRIEEGLSKLEIKGDELEGILITHEHVDHIQGSAESMRFQSMQRPEPLKESGIVKVSENFRKAFYMR